jgi:2-polyprenyl-6-methoxyphenol hydroxylase-like FAD-dependent oxidoreductase
MSRPSKHKELKAVIIGAGLSGLCLAQRLKAEGWKVSVFERDSSPEIRGQGYRLTIDAVGARALRACLPPNVYEFICNTAKGVSGGSGFVFLNERAETIYRISFSPSMLCENERAIGQVDRRVLRQALLIGLDGCVHFGKQFSGYEESQAGVSAKFSDGHVEMADILVGADGIHSQVRQQRLPNANPRETGISAVYGKTRILERKLTTLDPLLSHSGFVALGAKGVNCFATAMRFPEAPVSVAARLNLRTGSLPSEDYVMWGVAFHTEQRGEPGIHSLRELALRQINGFLVDFKILVQEADEADLVLVPIRATPNLRPWHPGRVTLMGDAIHAMPPFGANGANTALRDAETLSKHLTSKSEDFVIEERIGAYETEMLKYGQKAINSGSRQMQMTTTQSVVAQWFVKAMFRCMDMLSRRN